MTIKLSLPQSTILSSLSRGPMRGIKRTPPVMVLVAKGLAEFVNHNTLEITEAGKRFHRGEK